MVHVLKVELDSSQSCDLREIFSVCGEIRGIYPCNSPSGHETVFIDFAEYESIKRALDLHLNVSGVRVLTPSMAPQFGEECHAANPTAFESPSVIRDKLLENTPETQCRSARSRDQWLGSLDSGQDRYSAQEKLGPISLPNAETFSNPFLSTSTPVNVHTNVSFSNSVADSADANRSRFFERGETTIGTSLPSPTLVEIPSVLTSSLANSPLIHIDSSKSASAMTVPCIPLTTRIHMSLCGEIFAYDLDCLQSDPREIVELLRATGSERGNWMIVGAHYRRRGNPRAAIAVITAMLEVMAKHQVPEQELRPAFLLLSSCETDLGKRMHADGKENARGEHYRNSQMWLQKVYGTVSTTSSNTSSSSCRADAKHCEIPPRLYSPSSPLSDRFIHREIQSLRKRLHHQADLLSDARYSKRRLDDDYDMERNLRRRLERQVDDLKRQLGDARNKPVHSSRQVSEREIEDHPKTEEETKLVHGKHYRPQRHARSP